MRLGEILVAVDGTPSGQHALEYALELASVHGAHLTAVVVEGRLPRYAALIGEVADARGTRRTYFTTIARLARHQAEEHDVRIDVERRFGTVESALLAVAASRHCDLVVLGLRAHLGRLVPRMHPARLARRTACPLVLVR